MILNKNEIEQLANECGLYVVEGRHTLGLAIEHETLKLYKDSWFRYCDRKDIVVKFSEERNGNGKYTGRFELQDLFSSAMYTSIEYRHQHRRKPIICGDCGCILYFMKENQCLAPEMIIKALAVNLKLRLDDLMTGGKLSAKKQHMREIKNCGGEYEAV